jgi:regulator of cell morphogenesis and NO signaling
MNHPAAADPRAEQTLGQIAVDLPGATAVFRRLKLDFCCGGQALLREACAGRGVDAAAVLAELAALDRGAPADAPRDPAALVDHILERYHEVHRAQLPELIAMARRVEAVHRDHPQRPTGLADLLETMLGEMVDHMAKEENILFPLLKAGGHPMVMHPIAVMRHEHTSHGTQLERLAALTSDHTPPADACTTWLALYAGTRQFSDDLMQHIHLENNLLFPRFETAADAGQARACC